MRGFGVVALLAAVLAWAAPAVAAPSRRGFYTVRPGDSLSLIARRYGVSVQSLAAANRLNWHQLLPIGLVLHVPLSRARAKPAGAIYLVRPGDTLSGIALRYHVTVERLAAANRIDPAGVLEAGVRLRVPSSAALPPDLTHISEHSPYRQGALGYDVSYPNCAVRTVPNHAFAVIGLNHGRPFTTNPCFGQEWVAVAPRPSVYINTAYSPRLFKHIRAACRARATDYAFRPAVRRAYALGCSEAAAALELLAARAPAVIWLDVEPDNSWSQRRDLNATTIRGILESLLEQPRPPVVGIYSTPLFWRRIVGTWSTPSLPEWVATRRCSDGFAAGPVWLTQDTRQELDRDRVC